MQFICLEQGIYRAEPSTDILGRPETALSSYDFFRPDAPSGEMRELYLSPQITAIGEHALYCKNLEKLHLHAGIRKLGHAIFFYCLPARGFIEIVYEGTSQQFAALGAPFREQVRVEAAGPYDRQPYCDTQDSGYYYEERERRFDASVADCRVLCADGVTLRYGYQTREG